jgi:CRISPR-associated protein Cmr1
MENILKAKEVISLKKIEATFKIVTPMFMAGSDQKQAEFRIPSLLGALRFWYRATAPADLLNNISKLREAEAKLFGSTDTGQASFLVRDNSSQITTADANNARWANNKHGICYLGYGTMNFRGQVQRNYIKEGSTINIKFIFRPLKDSDIQGLRRALEALSLFGGLGSRSRRGFGSVTLLTLADEDGNDLWRAPRNREELQTQISSFISRWNLKDKTREPSYTAFTSLSQVRLSQTHQNHINLLDNIGEEMIRYRSYGRRNHNGDHTLPGNMGIAEQLFSSDHDLVQSLGNVNITSHPRRVAFGLPHNYFFGSTRLKFDITGASSERRASPLFIHIHQLGREYAAVLTYLPARFLPDNEKIRISGHGTKTEVPVQIDNSVIPVFLARIRGATEVS